MNKPNVPVYERRTIDAETPKYNDENGVFGSKKNSDWKEKRENNTFLVWTDEQRARAEGRVPPPLTSDELRKIERESLEILKTFNTDYDRGHWSEKEIKDLNTYLSTNGLSVSSFPNMGDGSFRQLREAASRYESDMLQYESLMKVYESTQESPSSSESENETMTKEEIDAEAERLALESLAAKGITAPTPPGSVGTLNSNKVDPSKLGGSSSTKDDLFKNKDATWKAAYSDYTYLYFPDEETATRARNNQLTPEEWQKAADDAQQLLKSCHSGHGSADWGGKSEENLKKQLEAAAASGGYMTKLSNSKFDEAKGNAADYVRDMATYEAMLEAEKAKFVKELTEQNDKAAQEERERKEAEAQEQQRRDDETRGLSQGVREGVNNADGLKILDILDSVFPGVKSVLENYFEDKFKDKYGITDDLGPEGPENPEEEPWLTVTEVEGMTDRLTAGDLQAEGLSDEIKSQILEARGIEGEEATNYEFSEEDLTLIQEVETGILNLHANEARTEDDYQSLVNRFSGAISNGQLDLTDVENNGQESNGQESGYDPSEDAGGGNF